MIQYVEIFSVENLNSFPPFSLSSECEEMSIKTRQISAEYEQEGLNQHDDEMLEQSSLSSEKVSIPRDTKK